MPYRLIPMFVSGVAFALGCVCPVLAEDDSWTIDLNKQHPPVSQENRILKWCADAGDGVRFASANIELKGYHPCGELQTAMQCDPSGARMINPGGEFPSTYRDCSLGPRISVVRRDPLPAVAPDGLGEAPPGSSPEGSATNEGLSPGEQRRLKREFSAAQQQQERAEQKEIEQAMKAVLGAFGGLQNADPERRRNLGSSGSTARNQQQQIEQLMRLMMQP